MDSQGAKSVVSEDMQNLGHGAEDKSNQASGYKAAISNPSTLFSHTAIEPHSPCKLPRLTITFFRRYIRQGKGGGEEEARGIGRRGCLLRQDWGDYKRERCEEPRQIRGKRVKGEGSAGMPHVAGCYDSGLDLEGAA